MHCIPRYGFRPSENRFTSLLCTRIIPKFTKERQVFKSTAFTWWTLIVWRFRGECGEMTLTMGKGAHRYQTVYPNYSILFSCTMYHLHHNSVLPVWSFHVSHGWCFSPTSSTFQKTFLRGELKSPVHTSPLAQVGWDRLQRVRISGIENVWTEASLWNAWPFAGSSFGLQYRHLDSTAEFAQEHSWKSVTDSVCARLLHSCLTSLTSVCLSLDLSCSHGNRGRHQNKSYTLYYVGLCVGNMRVICSPSQMVEHVEVVSWKYCNIA